MESFSIGVVCYTATNNYNRNVILRVFKGEMAVTINAEEFKGEMTQYLKFKIPWIYIGFYHIILSTFV